MLTYQLSDRLWSVSDGQVRSIFVEGDHSVIAFDTFGTPGRARAYRSAVDSAIPGKPVGTIIYTHDHLDHAGFAADFAPAATIIADEMTAKVIKLREADGQLAVTQTLSGRENKLTLDGVEFLLINPGPTHGTGNLSAYFADERLLFSCDTILPNARYGLMPDYHLANFVRYMRELLELDFARFVPGRYEVTDRDRFSKGCDYIEAMAVACQQAFVEMVPIWVHDAMARHEARKVQLQQFAHISDEIGQVVIRHQAVAGIRQNRVAGKQQPLVGKISRQIAGAVRWPRVDQQKFDAVERQLVFAPGQRLGHG